MAAIHFDGFYCSSPIPWEDWHAGVKMHGKCLHYRRFFSNGIWLGAYRENPFDFWAESEQLDSHLIDVIKLGCGPSDNDANPLWIAGSYEIVADELVQSLCPDSSGGYAWVSRYQILNDRITGPTSCSDAITLLFTPAPVTRGTG